MEGLMIKVKGVSLKVKGARLTAHGYSGLIGIRVLASPPPSLLTSAVCLLTPET